jgi:hypothetical protein
MALLLLLLPLAASAAEAEPSRAPATALFVLGDSTVSCATTALPLNLTAPSLSRPCLFPSTRRLLPDLLAAKMGLPPPPLISTINGTAAAVAGGVNFGGQYGGERVFRAGAAVGQQLRVAVETLQLEAATSSGAVFVLSFGADAYARLLARGPAADAAAPKHGRRGFGRILADRVARTVSVLAQPLISISLWTSETFDPRACRDLLQELYEADVRRVAVMGVAPLGCAPRVMWEGMRALNNKQGRSSCVDDANELIQGYNARLAAQLDELRVRLPDADIVFCDVYKGMMEIISNPRRYGTKTKS